MLAKHPGVYWLPVLIQEARVLHHMPQWLQNVLICVAPPPLPVSLVLIDVATGFCLLRLNWRSKFSEFLWLSRGQSQKGLIATKKAYRIPFVWVATLGGP